MYVIKFFFLRKLSTEISPLATVIMSQCWHVCVLCPGNGPVIPIANFKSDDAVAKTERLMRCKLASCYRLIDMFGWAHGSLGIVTVHTHSHSLGN